MERGEFATFVKPTLMMRSGIKALEWIPLVPDDERSAYEAAAQQDGLAGFRITERDADGVLVTAAKRDEYFPVYFVEPMIGNEAAVGFDLASSATRLAALVESRDSGRPVASAKITLVQETGEQFGFLVFHPIYLNGAPTGTVEQRRENLLGFVLGVYRIADMLQKAVEQADPESKRIDLEYRLRDRSAPMGEQALLSGDAHLAVVGHFDTEHEHGGHGDEGGGLPDLYFVGTVDVGGRSWEVVITSNAVVHGWRDLLVLGGGTFLTLMLVLYLAMSWRRTRIMEQTVVDRTREIGEANRQLEANIDELDESRAEQATLADEFRQLIDSAMDGLITIDDEGIVLTMNAAAEAMFVHAAEEVIGESVMMLMPESQGDQHIRQLHHYVQTGELRILGTNVEVEGLRSDGTEFPIDVSVNDFWRDDRRIFTIIMRDITERREIDRMRDQFVATVSHELRTPLTSLRGSLGLMSLDALGSVSDQAQRMLEIAVGNTDRLIRLVNDILDVEQMATGEMPIDRMWADSARIVATAVDEMQGISEAADITVTASDYSVNVWADPDRIVQTIANLLNNAIKFSPTGSTVRVSTEVRDDLLLFKVADEGRGIAPEHHEMIFDRFWQADSTDAREQQGTGLGLAICRSIVQQHGGSIWVESTVGEGSTFCFTVPLTSGDRAGTDTESARSTDLWNWGKGAT